MIAVTIGHLIAYSNAPHNGNAIFASFILLLILSFTSAVFGFALKYLIRLCKAQETIASLLINKKSGQPCS
ncbi:hypothetical protein KS4_07970 [Poriferisphaera corsica]|uniref:Uncharacterized protein n=1 Tax=Poriferisphaera corsica TaxID=2528020 RepID=A0A517YRA7_9BACT|nr:hypothetical protein [Poriferisphaera corsica]QDU32763.1 hypothetical protein KS4_07970 [Poriferisphaera corsica]